MSPKTQSPRHSTSRATGSCVQAYCSRESNFLALPPLSQYAEGSNHSSSSIQRKRSCSNYLLILLLLLLLLLVLLTTEPTVPTRGSCNSTILATTSTRILSLTFSLLFGFGFGYFYACFTSLLLNCALFFKSELLCRSICRNISLGG